MKTLVSTVSGATQQTQKMVQAVIQRISVMKTVVIMVCVMWIMKVCESDEFKAMLNCGQIVIWTKGANMSIICKWKGFSPDLLEAEHEGRRTVDHPSFRTVG